MENSSFFFFHSFMEKMFEENYDIIPKYCYAHILRIIIHDIVMQIITL